MSVKSYVSVLSVLLYLHYAAAIQIVSRHQWGAKPPTSVTKVPNNLPYVIIHHTASPGACHTPTDCKARMKSVQNYHQDSQGWEDIGYNFAIGGDGNIYEGRGFNVQGAHAPGYNTNGVGIVFIGDFTKTVPPQIMITRAKELIQYGVSKGKIARNYKLMGHRQVKATECPGTKLFNIIKTWPHFVLKP